MSDPAPRPGGKLGTLEIARFIAASIVVFTHYLPDIQSHTKAGVHTLLTGLMAPGAIAVQFFFVLSGFVMMTAHHRDFGRPGAPARFWWRRACRIYPIYWLALAIPVYYLSHFLTPGKLLAMITLQPAQAPDYVAPAWSLRFEVSFYIIFGLCLLPRIGRPLLAIWVAAVLWGMCPKNLRLWLHLPQPHVIVWLSFHHFSGFVSFFDLYFFAGLLGGWAYVRLRLAPRAGWLLLGLGAVTLALGLPAMRWGYSYGMPVVASYTGPAFAALILGLATLERHDVLRCGIWARRLGAVSYPLYIMHVSLMLIFDIHTQGTSYGRTGVYMVALLGTVAVYAICAALAFWVDAPLQTWLRKQKNFRSFVTEAWRPLWPE